MRAEITEEFGVFSAVQSSSFVNIRASYLPGDFTQYTPKFMPGDGGIPIL